MGKVVNLRHTYPPPFTGCVDITSLRAFNTEYENTSGKLMMIFVTVTHTIEVGGSAFGSSYVELQVSPSSPVSGVQSVSGVGLGLPFSPAGVWTHTLIAIVPPGYFYNIYEDSGQDGSTALNYVFEVT